jgi:GNAT superfamily N-acetyltransferase
VKRGIARDLTKLPKLDKSRGNANGGATVELLKVLLRMTSERHAVASKVIATVDDLEQIATDDNADVGALHGWRRELFGEAALALKRPPRPCHRQGPRGAGRSRVALDRSLPMPVVYRPAREHELERAEQLVVQSINDLTQRHGFGKMASLRPAHFQSFSLRDDPDGLWIAEDSGDILGFAFSWVCGDLWFLAELFVAPGQQGRGIGNELLARTLAHAETKKATRKALITFAFNTVSQGLYVQHGLLPRLPLNFPKISRDTLLNGLQNASIQAAALKATDLQHLSDIDAHALGTSREKHHRYLMSDPG